MTEIWKECEFDKRYKISTMGNVMSFTRNTDGLVMKCSILNKNKDHHCPYKYIQTQKDGNRKNRLVHRLVALAFIPNPDNLPYVDHIDRNTFNNELTNLRWVTHEDNMRNRYDYRIDIIGTTEERKSIYSKEYRQINKEKIKIQKQEKYNKNKEKLLEKFNCNCGGKYIFNHKLRHIKSKKHQDYLTKLSISPKTN